MKMMSMPKVREIESQVLDNKKETKKIFVEKSSFKSEYDKKTETLEKVKVKSKDIDKSKKIDGKVENPKTKDSKEAKVIKSFVPHKSSEISNKTTPVSLDSLKNIKIKSPKNSKKITKNIDTLIKNKKNTNKTDKDSLNQSIAAGQIITPLVQDKVELKSSTDTKKLTGEAKIEIESSDKKNINKNTVSNTLQSLAPKKNGLSSKKSQDKKKTEESKIKVKDFRTIKKDAIVNRDNNVNTEKVNTSQNSEIKTGDLDQAESGVNKTIILGSVEISAEGEGGKSQAPVMKEAASLLKQQLKDFGNNDIVKQSRFILKDNNIGEIKLILKPESLGQVRINLNLSENSLAGQIIVENNSVKEIFQENISQLSKALEDEGFDSAKLDVSLSDKKGSESENQKKNKQYFSERLKRFDDNGQVVRYGTPTLGINLTA